MKIVLAALNAKYVHSCLAVYDLEAYAKEKLARENSEKQDIEIKVCEYTINHNLDQILQALYLEKAAVVAFSCYIWNINEVLTIAKELKKVSPKLQIWLGGPEVSYDSEKLLEKNTFVDGIIRGEGEATFYDLIKVWSKSLLSKERAESLSKVLGITYAKQNADGDYLVCQNGNRSLISLDEVPFIYEDLSRFENRILYYETSRGCPFSCSYCLSSIDKTVRFRSIELVEKELQFFLDQKVSQVKFVDRTFNCKREHALAIWNYITEHDNGVTNFHFEVAADLIGDPEFEVFEKMRPGLIQLEIGLQSTNFETIKEIRRVMNIDKLKETLRKIKGFHNIHQHLDLIAGLPYEDLATFKQSFNDAYEMRPDQLQLGFLKVLKGSYMGEMIKEYELQYQDVQPYEVLSTKWISYEEILELKMVEEMVEVYYNSNQFTSTLAFLVPKFDSAYAFYFRLGQYYQAKNLFGVGYKRETRYGILRAFCQETLGDLQLDVLDCLLTFDYYLRENAKNRPGWSKEMPIDKQVYNAFFVNGGTKECVLTKEGYDSKVAARTMHIEPIVNAALDFVEGASGRDDLPDTMAYALFDYENRDPLSHSASVCFLSHL